MRSLLGAFGLVCGAIVVWTVGNYGYGSSDDPAVKWNMAFLFGAIACGGLFGHAVAARLWQVHRGISITIGLVCGAALVVNLSNSLGALAGRADKSTVERIAQNKRVKSDEAELARLQRQREAIPTFAPTDETAVAAAKRAADTASDNRRAECGNGDVKQRGPNCRQREIDEKAAADKLSTATTAKAATERAARLETAMAAIRQRLAAGGPVVTVNVQGSALARLFRLPDAEADFAVTVQQFGMAAIVELLIAFALIAWEMLRPTGAAKLTAPAVSREPDERSVEPVPPRLAIKALPRPKLVSSGPPAGGVSDFVVERLEVAKGSEIGFGEVYEDYMEWCRKRGADPLDSELFADAMKRICERARVRIRARGGTAVFVGLRFTAPASVARPLSITDLTLAMAEVDKIASKLDCGRTAASMRDASIIESECRTEHELMETRHDALAEALFHLDPETPNEVLSLALVLAHQLDLLLCNFTNHSTCIKARRAGDAVERAYQAILRGLIRQVGLTSPLLDRYYVTGQERVSSIERAKETADRADRLLKRKPKEVESQA